MKEYTIITDSCCDLSPELANKGNIRVIPMIFTVKEKEYLNYLDGRELNYKEFYKKLRDGEPSSTAAINMNVFEKEFEQELQNGNDVLYLSFSSGLSSTFGVSRMVSEELCEKYPGSKIICVDTLSASMGEGLIVYLAALKKAEGATIEEARDYVENNKLRLCHWFTVDDLNHLKRGGRVSAATALVGSLLNIKPILHVDNEGHLINVDKVRGRKASVESLFEHMKKTAQNPNDQIVFISHGDCEKDAEYLKELVVKEFSPKEIYINPIGPVIGSHSGPGTLALFYLGSER